MSVSEAFSSNVVVELLSSERLMDYWASLERDLLRHRDVWEERLTLEHIQRNCANGHYQVWLVGNREQVYLTIISQISEFPAGKVLQMFAAWGEVPNVIALMDSIEPLLEQFAVENGCRYIEEHGRPGWERWLKRKGGRKLSVVLRRRVGETTH